jgi:hypothetical protein
MMKKNNAQATSAIQPYPKAIVSVTDKGGSSAFTPMKD